MCICMCQALASYCLVVWFVTFQVFESKKYLVYGEFSEMCEASSFTTLIVSTFHLKLKIQGCCMKDMSHLDNLKKMRRVFSKVLNEDIYVKCVYGRQCQSVLTISVGCPSSQCRTHCCSSMLYTTITLNLTNLESCLKEAMVLYEISR